MKNIACPAKFEFYIKSNFFRISMPHLFLGSYFQLINNLNFKFRCVPYVLFGNSIQNGKFPGWGEGVKF